MKELIKKFGEWFPEYKNLDTKEAIEQLRDVAMLYGFDPDEVEKNGYRIMQEQGRAEAINKLSELDKKKILDSDKKYCLIYAYPFKEIVLGTLTDDENEWKNARHDFYLFVKRKEAINVLTK